MTGHTDTTADPFPEKPEHIRSVAAIVSDLVDGLRERGVGATLHLAAEGLPDAPMARPSVRWPP
jgi:hypothetical protein